MENQRIEQAILKSGGRIDPHTTPKTLQIFGEDGLPFNFESGGGGSNNPPGEPQEVKYLTILFMFVENDFDDDMLPMFAPISEGISPFYGDLYFVLAGQEDSAENGVYVYDGATETLVKTYELSDETPDYDVARIFYTWSGMPDSTYPESSRTAYGPDIPKNIVPFAVSHESGMSPDSWEAIVYLVENGTRTTPINSDNVSVMKFSSRGDHVGELPVGYTPRKPWPASLTGHLNGIDLALREANPETLSIAALIAYEIDLGEPFEDEIGLDAMALEEQKMLFPNGVLIHLFGQTYPNENGVYRLVGDETYSLELEYSQGASPGDEGFGVVLYGFRLGPNKQPSFGMTSVNVKEFDRARAHVEGRITFADLEELAYLPLGLPATNAGLVILPDALVQNSPFADPDTIIAMTLNTHLEALNDHLYSAPPESGTYSLKSVDGELTWVED